MAARMNEREAGDFYREFHEGSRTSPDRRLSAKLEALAKEIEPMDREFCRQTSRCGHEMGSVLEELDTVAERASRCGHLRLAGGECERLFQEVDAAIAHITSLRETCYI